MNREVSLGDISDGKLYSANDMVKVGCNDCKGCSECCGGMGNSITLDPLDVYRLSCNLNLTFQELLRESIELNMVEGIILPNLKMTEMSEKCRFLNESGRCSIHEFRPGICRLFPLGRFYEGRDFQYFLQIHECKKENRTKVKIRKWLEIPEIKEYEQFICDWHYFIKDVQKQIQDATEETKMKEINMSVLNLFYVRPYDQNINFYQTFYERLDQAMIFLKKYQ